MTRDLSRVGGPNPDAADGQFALAALRRAMFGRDEPVRIDRYRLLRKIGRGAQGTVYEAEDAELGRRLAIKILTAGDNEVDAADQRRLLREARAMASVSHPNVVEVYAAGRSHGQVWIAMELVRGTTLQQWLATHSMDDSAQRHKARNILRCAGEGLAAAHALGLVHRDFKPANVLLGDEGTVKLTDFGLARPFDWLGAEHLDTESTSGFANAGGGALASSNLTEGTVWAGTPRYMSLEQLRGRPAGVESDQFNFAVTAWEALFGVHPFEHDDVQSLESAISAQALSRPVARRQSRRLMQALEQALRAHPDDRHRSLRPLLDALEPRRRRRRRIAMFCGAGACVATALMWPVAHEPDQRCGLGDALARFESATGVSSQDIKGAIERTAIPDAQKISARVRDELDDYAQRWAERWSEVCEAAKRSQHSDSSDPKEQRSLDARTACLQQQLVAVDALATQLADADVALALQAVVAVRNLPDPQRCLRGEAWASATPRSRALRARVAAAAADALAGRNKEAAAEAERISVAATRESLPAVKIAALEVAANAYAELSDSRRFRALSDAYYVAAELDDLESMARLGGGLARQYAYDDQLDDARWWSRHGKAAVGPHTELEVRLVFEHTAGLIAYLDDDPERGEALLLGVLSTLEAQGDHTSETGWLVAMWLATYYSWRGRPEDALTLCEALRESITRELGEGHPRLSRIAMTQAVAAGKRGSDDAALGFGYEAVERAQQAYGPINERTAIGHMWLARRFHVGGRLGQADLQYRAGIHAAGDEPSKVKARILRGWGVLRTSQGRAEDALALLLRSEAIGEVVFDSDSEELAQIKRQLAEARTAVAQAR